MKLITVDPKIFDTEADYFPIYGGLKPSAMGLRKMTKRSTQAGEQIFIFGPSFNTFRANKEACRNYRLSMYYQKLPRAYPEIIKYIIETLATQNAEHFTLTTTAGGYQLDCALTQEQLQFNADYELVSQRTQLSVPFEDAFDALAMQVPEDLVIHHIPRGQLNPVKSEADKVDAAAAIHLCHCNGWTAEWAIGQTFNFIHKAVPRIDKIVPHATRMMLSFLNQETVFERIAAISIKTSPILNRHEAFQSEWDLPFNPAEPLMHMRVERQTVTGFPESEAFLFTIRTFLYDLDSSQSGLAPADQRRRHQAITEVIKLPEPRSYAYEVFMKHQTSLLQWLAEVSWRLT